MNVLETLQARYSLRDFAEKEIEEEKLEVILEAGRLAPTASNQRRTKVIVVRDPALRQGMVDACSGQAFVGKAPAILVVCADNDRLMRCGQSPPHGRLLHRPVLHVCPGRVPGGAGALDRRF